MASKVALDLKHAKRLIVKVGSSLIACEGVARAGWMASLASDIAEGRARGQQVVIVSSGAVALGRAVLSLSGPLRLAEKQAAAAAGQARLMRAWEEAFRAQGIPVAQALLTPDDTERRQRWLNARATLETLLDRGAVPIINENDTVATQELRYGDNDRLAARVAQMLSADVLALLSDVDGLYDRDPRTDKGAQHIGEVRAITPAIEAMAGGANSQAGVGTGGMRTKLEAARIAQAAGCSTVIFEGAMDAPLTRLNAGARCTWFVAQGGARQAYKAWIAGSLSTGGAVRVDAGAAAAIRAGKSLLVAGVVDVSGGFDKGDAVRVVGPDGAEIARGLARYDAADASTIKGLKSDQIELALGFTDGPVLVHQDDMTTRV
ncbi:MAG: glutamate 5-kinase [Caulobacterales bacterium]|jgi:glutamate 5-kinase